MKDELYVTISKIEHYYGLKPFTIGNIIKLAKEPENALDSEAIYAHLPYIGKIGYVANKPNEVLGGTFSAGRLYDHVDDTCLAEVLFTTPNAVIAKVYPVGEMHFLLAVNLSEEAYE